MAQDYVVTPLAKEASEDAGKMVKELESGGHRDAILGEIHNTLAQMSTEDRKSYMQYLNTDMNRDLKADKLPAVTLTTNMGNDYQSGLDSVSMLDSGKNLSYTSKFNEDGSLHSFDESQPTSKDDPLHGITLPDYPAWSHLPGEWPNPDHNPSGPMEYPGIPKDMLPYLKVPKDGPGSELATPPSRDGIIDFGPQVYPSTAHRILD